MNCGTRLSSNCNSSLPQYLLESEFTAEAILALLLTVDGLDSGLDADLLDGLSAAAFELSGVAAGLMTAHLLAADPHTQYLLESAYAPGVTDHGLLTGLNDDDHPQYHNDARGDARYSLLAHTHAIYAPLSHAHAGEDITSGTVADARIATTITRDSEVVGIVQAAAVFEPIGSVAAHVLLADPHTQYLLESAYTPVAPGGSVGQVQIHGAGGVFVGDAGLAFDIATDVLTVAGRVVTPKLSPAADSTTAILVTKSDGSTAVETTDTTNSRKGINVTPTAILHAKSTAADYGTKLFRLTDSAGVDLMVMTSDARMYVGADNGGFSKFTIVRSTSNPAGIEIFAITDQQTTGSPTMTFAGSILGADGGNQKAIGWLAPNGNAIFWGNPNTWTEEFSKSSAGKFYFQPGRSWGAGGDIITVNPATFTSGNFVNFKIGSTTQFAVNFDGRIIAPKWSPSADSTTAIQITKADGSTAVVTVDTTNGLVGIGVSPTTHKLEIVSSTVNILKVTRNNTNNAPIEFGNAAGTFFFGTTATSANFGIGIAAGLDTAAMLTITRTAKIGVGQNNVAPTHIFHVRDTIGVTNSIVNLAKIEATLSGTPIAGYGTGILFALKSDTTLDQDAGRLTWEWVTPTHASRASKGKLSAYYTTTERVALTWEANSTESFVTINNRLVTPKWSPAADSTTAIQITKADGSTAVVTVDTTNSRVGIGTAPSTDRVTVAGTLHATVNLSAGNSFYIPSKALLVFGTTAIDDTGNAYTFAEDGGTLFRQIKTSSIYISSGTAGALVAAIRSDGRLIAPKWSPVADSTTALQITKADGSTDIVTVNTTNRRVRINGGTGATPTVSGPLEIQIDTNGVAFVISNSATEYTYFVSGGVKKGLLGKGTIQLALENDGDVYLTSGGVERLRATSTGLAFHGITPVARSTGWSVSNVTPDKVFDANATTLDEVADVLGTLITYLISRGDLGA